MSHHTYRFGWKSTTPVGTRTKRNGPAFTPKIRSADPRSPRDSTMTNCKCGCSGSDDGHSGCGCGGNSGGCGGCGGCGNSVRVHGCGNRCNRRNRRAAFASGTNTSLTAFLLVAGDGIGFNVLGPMSNITHAAGDGAFVVGLPGTYRVSVTVQTDLTSALGGIQVTKNGTGVGSPVVLSAAGSPIVLEQLVSAQAGDTLRVSATGLGITLAPGTNATITITKV